MKRKALKLAVVMMTFLSFTGHSLAAEEETTVLPDMVIESVEYAPVAEAVEEYYSPVSETFDMDYSQTIEVTEYAIEETVMEEVVAEEEIVAAEESLPEDSEEIFDSEQIADEAEEDFVPIIEDLAEIEEIQEIELNDEMEATVEEGAALDDSDDDLPETPPAASEDPTPYPYFNDDDDSVGLVTDFYGRTCYVENYNILTGERKLATGWKKIDGIWYFFDDNGLALTGVKKIWNTYYLFDSKGAMLTGKVDYDGDVYYISRTAEEGGEGHMYIDQFVMDGENKTFVDETGKRVSGWRNILDGWYFFDPYTLKGLQNILDTYYVFDDDGKVKTGKFTYNDLLYFGSTENTAGKAGALKTEQLVEDQGKSYYVRANGAAVKGWKLLDNTWYFFSDTYDALTGLQKIWNTLYLFTEKGAMLTGKQYYNGDVYYISKTAEEGGEGHVYTSRFITDNGNKTYVDADGKRASGWRNISDAWYYFDPFIKNGWQKIGSFFYVFEDSGKVKTGAFTDGGKLYFGSTENEAGKAGAIQTNSLVQDRDGKKYYVKDDGSAVKGWKQLENGWYYFDDSYAAMQGFQKLWNTVYYFTPDGPCAEGYAVIKGLVYYFTEGASCGHLVTNQNISFNGYTFKADENGVLSTTYIRQNELQYLFRPGEHLISNCGQDENGNTTGGVAGDQTGNEWWLKPYYDRPWNVVLRFSGTRAQEVRELFTALSIRAALNDNIGYDYNQRTTYWTQLSKVGYAPDLITTPCESDCSAGVSANIRAVGYLLGITALKNISYTNTTYIMRSPYVSAGFKALTGVEFIKSSENLLPGDILLNDAHHTAANISFGSNILPKVTVVDD